VEHSPTLRAGIVHIGIGASVGPRQEIWFFTQNVPRGTFWNADSSNEVHASLKFS
jgi:hypothetical protein